MKNSVKIIQNLQTLVILGMLAFFTISMVASDDHTNEKNTTVANVTAWDYNGLGEIKMFAGNFAPRNWAFCNGQILPITQNQALFSLLGTTYGGDGRTTFGLPDLRGRVAVHAGGETGPGLTSRPLGSMGGAEANTLSEAQLPAHRHTTQLEGEAYMSCGYNADESNPGGSFLAPDAKNRFNDTANGRMGKIDLGTLSVKLGVAGQSQAVNNMQPYLGVNYIICLQGTYPSRN